MIIQYAINQIFMLERHSTAKYKKSQDEFMFKKQVDKWLIKFKYFVETNK